MNGNGTFNHHILVDKLAKLNNSQQSIETLSHWCIFHRKKAKQVVETWDQQFHHSPRDQRLSFLYLANDILQNSRRKGAEFVAEFWKVLPDALNDVTENGDDFGRKAALRLVDIWEDRKVFGSRGHILKDVLLGRSSENKNSTGTSAFYKLKQPSGDLLENIISSYHHIFEAHIDEESLFGRCRSAISSVEKMEKEMGNNFSLGNINGSGVIEELLGQNNILRECMEQLKMAESSRTALQSHLREALHEQELKIDQVRKQLQAVLSRYEQTSTICQQFPSMDPSRPPADQKPNDAISESSSGFLSKPLDAGDAQKETAPVRYTQQQQLAPPPPPPLLEVSSPRIEEDQRKNTAAEVAAKLTASTSSAQMLSFVLSSLASEGIMGGQSIKEDYPSDAKRPKLESSVPPYIPASPHSQPPPPPFPHPDSVGTPPPPPPPPLVAPLMPPATGPQQFMPVPGSMMAMQYGYGSSPLQLPPHPLPAYPMVGMPPYLGSPNPFLQGFPTSEGIASFGQPPLPATQPPLSRQ